MTTILSPWTRFLGVCLTVNLVACSTPGADVSALKVTSPQALQLASDHSTAVSPRWWMALGDAQLNRLIDTALQGSPTLATAQLRVQRMQALAGLAQAAGRPQATLGADFTRQRFSANGLYPKPIAGNTWDNDTVQASVSWSPDLWGQHAAEWASALGQVRATQADTAAAETGLASQISKAYVALARWVAQRDIAERAAQQRHSMQQLISARYTAGLDTQVEQTQSEGNVADAQGQLEALQEQIALTRNQLAILSGQAPQAVSSLTPQLQALRLEAMPATLGADLLGRRPDVMASRWRVEAASQDVQVARTQFYPNVNLSAFVGFNALGLSHLLDGSSQQFGVSPAVRLPLFDGGRLQAQLSGRQAERDMAVAQYNSTVLEAVKETTDAISSAQSLARQAITQAGALRSAQKNHALAQQRFDAGLGNALAVLSAETALLSQHRAQIDNQARQLDNRINLMKALGGGWRDDTAVPAPQ
jgi:NodT family efflux transporter outer membrane factor (OMF) lipoprotein